LLDFSLQSAPSADNLRNAYRDSALNVPTSRRQRQPNEKHNRNSGACANDSIELLAISSRGPHAMLIDLS
jgi:hypothetical protein